MNYLKPIIFLLALVNINLICSQSTETKSIDEIEKIKTFIVSKNLDKLNEMIDEHNVNILDSTGLSLLTNAIKTKDINVVKTVLQKGANTNLQNMDYYGTIPLMYCVSSNLIEIASLLIKNGADVNIQDKFGDPVIHWSAYYGNVEFTELLLKNKAKTNLKSKHSDGAMQVGLKEWQDSLVDLLIKYNVSLHKVDKQLKPLINAVKNNDITFALNKITKDNANAKDESGSTLLMIAAEKGYLDIVKKLLDNNADINALNPVGHSALNRAVYFNRKEVVNYLLENGADADKCDIRFGLTPLMAAARTNRLDLGELLLNNNVDINKTDGINNFSAIMWAAVYENIDFIKLLLKHKPDLNIISNYDTKVFDLTTNQDILSLLQKANN